MNLFTIGYAGKPVSDFISYLKQHGVTALVDVRSSPFSGMYKEYNEDRLFELMPSHGMLYMPMGRLLGPRSPLDEHYDESGQVDFRKLAKSEPFIKGVNRLKHGLDRGYKIAMLCAEKDAATCHRSILIADHFLHQESIDVLHIQGDGSLEKQTDIEARLAVSFGFMPDMFMTEEECRLNAIKEQSKKVAYKKA
ncbi:DUF488 family protein [Vibrio owensii]|uniref:DUF488 domain-containing protein n=1 Tax=Vibrio harveyi group TaxID=717610 RepID=UPI003CC57F51